MNRDELDAIGADNRGWRASVRAIHLYPSYRKVTDLTVLHRLTTKVVFFLITDMCGNEAKVNSRVFHAVVFSVHVCLMDLRLLFNSWRRGLSPTHSNFDRCLRF